MTKNLELKEEVKLAINSVVKPETPSPTISANCTYSDLLLLTGARFNSIFTPLDNIKTFAQKNGKKRINEFATGLLKDLKEWNAKSSELDKDDLTEEKTKELLNNVIKTIEKYSDSLQNGELTKEDPTMMFKIKANLQKFFETCLSFLKESVEFVKNKIGFADSKRTLSETIKQSEIAIETPLSDSNSSELLPPAYSSIDTNPRSVSAMYEEFRTDFEKFKKQLKENPTIISNIQEEFLKKTQETQEKYASQTKDPTVLKAIKNCGSAMKEVAGAYVNFLVANLKLIKAHGQLASSVLDLATSVRNAVSQTTQSFART